jgi:hypothetical protein
VLGVVVEAGVVVAAVEAIASRWSLANRFWSSLDALVVSIRCEKAACVVPDRMLEMLLMTPV